MLKANFKNIGHAPEKIERGEFVIQYSALKRDIDFDQNWQLCFSPGQCVDMSMIFHRATALEGIVVCPTSGKKGPDCSGEEAEWWVIIKKTD